MRRILAALAVFAAIAGASAVSQATTVHITYTGTVTYVSDPGGTSGFSLGDPIAGSMTINLDGIYYDACCNPVSQTRFFEGVGTGRLNNFYIFGQHDPYPNEFSNGIFYNPAQVPNEEWQFVVGTNLASYVRFFRDGIAPIIPTAEANLANLRSLVDAGLLSVDGSLNGPADAWSIDFAGDSINASVTLTPIPAALPLFASALGSLGLFGWRRRRA